MNISVELTLTPLQDDYETPIIAFIKKLRASGLKVLENPLSTQVYGDFDTVMKVLNEEGKAALEMTERGILLLKIVKSDRRNYEPHF
ncbi:thiamine-binding protein [Urechidicola vernalis]|uniref:Thiamine-binding protein n=1 Tax=Urechidicola vernalis TaxID=3075600 RepID=A0ABU2Y913_9FLAO|nr:thiamine-binding protein [Urechidicola sp. P050]MDT0553558.1 thiamine-binding protein [Urechidicola sp. P050]